MHQLLQTVSNLNRSTLRKKQNTKQKNLDDSHQLRQKTTSSQSLFYFSSFSTGQIQRIIKPRKNSSVSGSTSFIYYFTIESTHFLFSSLLFYCFLHTIQLLNVVQEQALDRILFYDPLSTSSLHNNKWERWIVIFIPLSPGQEERTPTEERLWEE